MSTRYLTNSSTSAASVGSSTTWSSTSGSISSTLSAPPPAGFSTGAAPLSLPVAGPPAGVAWAWSVLAVASTCFGSDLWRFRDPGLLSVEPVRLPTAGWLNASTRRHITPSSSTLTTWTPSSH
eukprot:CAMPEP_0202831236 /NCGR_PEP_ID=MMETSP1389-20130828/16712_1 /ASSEMBLY_ACC=CAM_ASM_000865 /TAXON_ID=302021 /ORGANISM="Rhodomonas sp., Strain CCMP768" /LENGTH=122 /DNA_ID=CAMNT_0049504955 /DNA_START=232 /DNA_END=600 /DNA_ORIENTATION=+